MRTVALAALHPHALDVDAGRGLLQDVALELVSVDDAGVAGPDEALLEGLIGPAGDADHGLACGVEVVLPEEITLEEAIKINLESLKREGIEEIKKDGTLVSTEEGYEINKEILGVDLREIRFADMEDVSKELISVYRKLADKYNAFVPVY